MAIRDLRIYAQPSDASVYHYRDTYGLEADAVIETPDGRWIAAQVKLGRRHRHRSGSPGATQTSRSRCRGTGGDARPVGGRHRRTILLGTS